MDRFDYARELFISLLRQGKGDKFNQALLQKKLRLSVEDADSLYIETLKSVKH